MQGVVGWSSGADMINPRWGSQKLEFLNAELSVWCVRKLGTPCGRKFPHSSKSSAVIPIAWLAWKCEHVLAQCGQYL